MYKAYKGYHEDADRDSDDIDEEADDRNRDEDADDKDDDDDRIGRFVDVGENAEVFKSKTFNDLKPFYHGTTLDERMAEIRKSIYYIRQNWSEFDSFMKALQTLMLEDEITFTKESDETDANKLFNSKRDWLTSAEASDKDVNYEAIKLYTSKEGHAQIYRVCNGIFRKEDSVATVEMIRSAVFLVELINIDLYNYCLQCPKQRNFEGEVYRGMCVTQEEMETFQQLRKEPMNRRNIAVPLGLFSASSSEKVARTFIKQQLKRQKDGDEPRRPLIIKTHVIGLKPEYVDHYTKTFPTTVLTTICAVDIHKLSRHPKEREVLLRGPFQLILDMYENDRGVAGKPCYVLEAVMLNANRDHISTSMLGDQDVLARDLFATMVAVTRSEFAVDYCKSKGLAEDAQEYQTILEKSTVKLTALMKR